MTESKGYSGSSGDLPEEFAAALAFYDEQVGECGVSIQARLATLEKFPDWAYRLRQQFQIEDKVQGIEDTRPHWHESAVSGTFGAAVGDAKTRLIPRYRLGIGGQGEVWLAHDPDLDRFVALKIVRQSDRGSKAACFRIWKEAELTGKLQHPNIVPVYDANRGQVAEQSGSSPYYVMRVYGDKHFLRAIAAFHARERRPEDFALLDAIHNFHDERSDDRQEQLQRLVQAFAFDDSQASDRELKEAVEALQQEGGDPSGRNLQQAIKAYHAAGRPQSELRELLNRFIDVCNAMAYAHTRGVIHRDLKPQNIMLGEFGETLVLDWGLAKLVVEPETATSYDQPANAHIALLAADDDDSKTREGHFRGTRGYSSPEQEQGRLKELSPASDIYSLGGVLYAILTGKPPQSSTASSSPSSTGTSLRPPTALQADIPKPLEAVCLKALSQSQSARYASAKDLAADVTRWLSDDPVTAWREPIVVRAKRWVKGHQTLVGSTAAAVLVAVVTLSVMMVIVNSQKNELATAYSDLGELHSDMRDTNTQLDTTNKELIAANEREEQAREDAENQANALRQMVSRGLFDHGVREFSDGRIDRANQDLLSAWFTIAPDDPLRREYLFVLTDRALQSWRQSTPPLRHEQLVVHMAFSPDGARLATTSRDAVQLWDATNGVPLGEPLRHGTFVVHVAFSPDGARLATASLDGTARLWDARSGVPLGQSMWHRSAVVHVAFSPVGERLATASNDGAARLWDTHSGVPLGQPMLHGGQVAHVTFSPDGEQLATASNDGTAAVMGRKKRHPVGGAPAA